MENGDSELLNVKKWNCSHCTRNFDSRGKRDAHTRKEHQKLCHTLDLSDQSKSVQRSEEGKFVCSCGKGFWRAQSLQRHSKGCIDSIWTVEDDLESIQREERNASNPDVIVLQ